MTAYVGFRLGLYEALRSGKWTTAKDVAHATGTHARYVREWLEQQAVAGFLEVQESTHERAFRLSLSSRSAFLDEADVEFSGHLVTDFARVARQLPALVEAFKTGERPSQPSWAPEGRPDVNKATFLGAVVKEWLPMIDPVHSRLKSEVCSVADLGCGTGWSSIALSLAYPSARIVGFDVDEKAIEVARQNNESARSKADFLVCAAGELAKIGQNFDVVTIFEAFHDMAHPVDILRRIKGKLGEDGVLLIADERVGDEFAAPGNESERVFYAWSVLACLSNTVAEDGSSASGAILRPSKLKDMASDAGFVLFEEVEVNSPLWRFYLLQ